MSSKSRDSLIQSLAELSHLYPEMRLGQLIAFLGSVAGKGTPGNLEECDDAVLLQAAEGHIRKRAQQLGVGVNHEGATLSAQRKRALAALALCMQNSTLPVGRLLHERTRLGEISLYDIEDERLECALRAPVAEPVQA